MQWFPLYPSDFIGATVGLSCQEVSVYSWMLTLYYELGPFPLERIRTYRIVRCESDEQKRTVDDLLNQFFVEKADGWYQPRAEAERVKQAQFHELAVARGKRSANVRMTKYGTAQPGRVADPERAFESVSKAFGKEPELTTTTTTTTKEEKIKEGRASRFALTQLPEDWELFCKQERPDLNPRAVFASFRDWWIAKPGKEGRKLDWTATWRNWVRNQRRTPDWAKPKQTPEQVADEALRMMEDR
jgi:uncharacterized protein YdaU (DUF1376 family)